MNGRFWDLTVISGGAANGRKTAEVDICAGARATFSNS
jgi:hypothetical protein